MDFDVEVKLAVYRHVAETTAAPGVEQVAARLEVPAARVREAYARLAGRRVLVLEGDGETIRMAPPFSGVPTQHRVRLGGRDYFANCAWDALGIPAALHLPGEVSSRCEQSLEPIHLEVTESGPRPEPCLAHFAVPAARWWEDIVYT
jgi:hypothetical protein